MSVLLVLVAVVIAEVFVIIQVAHHIGVGWTLLLLVVFSLSGPWLVRRTGTGVWRRARARLSDGEVPGREIIDGVLLLAAGVMLTVPGFVTGILGALLLLPPVRAVARRVGAWWLARRAVVEVWTGGPGRDGDSGPVISAGSRRVDHRVPPSGDGRVLGPASGGPPPGGGGVAGGGPASRGRAGGGPSSGGPESGRPDRTDWPAGT